MNIKRYLLAFFAVFVFVSLANFAIHGVLLHSAYVQSGLVRTEADGAAHAPFLGLAFLFFSLGFAWMYAQGVNAKPWLGQGLRFGLAVWMITSLAEYTVYYAVQPWTASVVFTQIGCELIMNLLAGAIVAGIYRER